MHRMRLRWVIPFALAAIGMVVIAPSAGAATPNLNNGCKAGTTAAATMGQYPAWPGSQSYMRIACIFNHSTGGSGDFVSNTFTIHDFANAVYHNGAARSVTASAAVVAGSLAIPVNDCTSMNTGGATSPAWTNRVISGPGIPVRGFITGITGTCTPTGTLNLNRPTNAAINAGDTFLVENSIVRSVLDGVTSVAAPNVCSATMNFTAADVGLSIDGTNLAPGTTITALDVTPNCVDTSVAPTAAGTAQVITVGGTLDGSFPAATAVTSTRTVNDVTFAATNTLTSTVARFFVSDVGLQVTSPTVGDITPPCYIQSRTSATVVVLSSACNNGVAGTHTVTIGEPSRTAPKPTDTVLNQGVQLPLNPSLVAGSQPCTADNSSGFGIEGTWLNPGSFVGGAFATQPPNTRAVGEILFSTSVITYGAYVLEMGAASVDPTIAAYHFNIVFPNVPTGLALCPSTATSPGLGLSIGINSTVVSQAAIPTGQGRPATAQLRSTRASTTGASATDFITDDVNGAGVKWTGANFNRLCSVPAGTPDINFVCGVG